MRNTNNKKSEKTQERVFLSLTQIDNNQALISANEGFISSDGCIENPKNLRHLENTKNLGNLENLKNIENLKNPGNLKQVRLRNTLTPQDI